MNSEIGLLIEELKLIRDNVCGGLKTDSNINLTHSEVISFVRAFVKAVETEMITPFWGWTPEEKDKVIFYMNLIRTNGIPHCDRSRAAEKCLNFLEAECKKKIHKWIPRSNNWIPRMIGMIFLFNVDIRNWDE